MEKNKKRVFTGTVAMLVILFGLLRIAIFTGYHMVTPFLPEIARNLDTTIVVIGLAISIRSAMGFLGPVWGGIIDLFGKKNSLLIALLTFAASYAAIYFFPSFPCFVVALPISYAATLTFDSAMYSYLSEMIPYEGRGRMTAVLEAAYALGFMIGSPVAGVLMENFGWAVPFVLMAGIAVVFAIALGFILPKEGEKRFGIDATVSHEMQENKAEKAHISTDFRSYSRIKMPWQPFLPARFLWAVTGSARQCTAVGLKIISTRAYRRSALFPRHSD